MKHVATSIILIVLMKTVALSQDPLSWDALLTLASSEASDDEVLAEISSRSLGFVLQTRHLIELRRLGRSSKFLERLVKIERGNLGTAKRVTQEDEAPMLVTQSLSAVRPRLDPTSCGVAESGDGTLTDLETIAFHLDLSDPSMPESGRHRLSAAFGFLGLGLPAAACVTIQPLLGTEVADHEYACAILLLSEIRASYDCPLRDPLALANRNTINLPVNAASAHAYLVGVDVLRISGDKFLGEELLRRVEPQAPEYPLAVYQLAMLDIGRERYKSATKALLATAEVNIAGEDGVSLSDLSFLALGAIATENGLFAEAIESYRRIPPSSRMWAEATRQRAYAALKSGAFRDALGSILVLKNIFRDIPWGYFPELDLIEAASLAQLCYMDNARDLVTTALARLRTRTKTLSALSDPGHCDGDCRIGGLSVGKAIIEKVIAAAPAVLDDSVIRRLVRSSLESQREQFILAGPAQLFASLKMITDRIDEDIASRDKRLKEAIMEAVARERDEAIRLENDMMQFLVDLDSTKIETLTFQAREIMETRGSSFHRKLIEGACTNARRGWHGDDQIAWILSNGRDVVLEETDILTLRACGVPWRVLDYLRAHVIKQPANRSLVDPAGRDHRLVWEFDGELWRDELRDIRVELPDRCGTGRSPLR